MGGQLLAAIPASLCWPATIALRPFGWHAPMEWTARRSHAIPSEASEAKPSNRQRGEAEPTTSATRGSMMCFQSGGTNEISSMVG